MSEVFLNNTAKESTNTPNRSPDDEFCDSDIATSTCVCSSSLLLQISNPTRSDASWQYSRNEYGSLQNMFLNIFCKLPYSYSYLKDQRTQRCRVCERISTMWTVKLNKEPCHAISTIVSHEMKDIEGNISSTSNTNTSDKNQVINVTKIPVPEDHRDITVPRACLDLPAYLDIMDPRAILDLPDHLFWQAVTLCLHDSS
ncbi:hypothetical protein OS493_037947 [Desmophyllum pertusum]|uniref:Uncharacterized protein n=1 Tax=Desmophyllum pertusum TaxID=174260 RepID=A0A9W9ZIH4_9CNID|nr:hypothetical protein OS493_037947 [Desmophyllum pertusum]